MSEPDEGISDAFNKGISLSKGEIIGILSSDDWYEENTVEIIVKQFMENSADIICGSSQFWNNDKKIYL
ncbi:MAG: glycosyltransferase [Oscillatoriaceae cyanobacterium SKYGB_i_bin93]|nr:glycosyltransferase [Oscillatoriaceae cyanobacterium SKYGB_i_bin93]